MPHPGGAPRTVSPSPKECEMLGKELALWATEETEEFRCLFQQWYSIKKGILRKEWKTLIQRPEFVPYYEIAQAALAKRCIDGTMKEGFGHRYLRLYDRSLVEEENDNKLFDTKLKLMKESDDKQKQKNIIQEEAKEVSQAILEGLNKALKKQNADS